MKANYVHKDSTTLVQDELVKNELNQIELQYNALEQQKFNELLKENQELKKQLENMADSYCNASKLKHERASKIVKMNNQQKEFIKWLEDYLNLFDEKDIYEEGSYDAIEEILQKYKSIIGVSDDKTN